MAVTADMLPDRASQRFGHHNNTFGFLRLLFASFVIFAHTPELHDGNRNQEFLSRIFGTLSLGDFAVDCFFLVSGYLITSSCLNSRSTVDYFSKRIVRIYPGYLVAFILCVLVAVPLGGGTIEQSAATWAKAVAKAVALQMPELGTVFPGTSYPDLNGSMWTIAYEFRCYVFVGILGLAGLLRPSRVGIIYVLTLALVAAALIFPMEHATAFHSADVEATRTTQEAATLFAWNVTIGNLRETIRLTSIFAVGGCYFLLRDRLRFNRATIAIATIALMACLFSERMANPGVAIFGGFWFWPPHAMRMAAFSRTSTTRMTFPTGSICTDGQSPN